jgi:hypothetical protein
MPSSITLITTQQTYTTQYKHICRKTGGLGGYQYLPPGQGYLHNLYMQRATHTSIHPYIHKKIIDYVGTCSGYEWGSIQSILSPANKNLQ